MNVIHPASNQAHHSPTNKTNCLQGEKPRTSGLLAKVNIPDDKEELKLGESQNEAGDDLLEVDLDHAVEGNTPIDCPTS